MEELNLNQTIKVKLTAYGHKVYLEHWNNSKIWWGVNEIDRFKNLTYPKKVDSDGFSKFQLWEFMDIFGKHISMEVPVIKELNLYIEEENQD